MINRILLTATLLGCFFQIAQAQTTEDYVVTVRNDTLYGKVKYSAYTTPNTIVTVKNKDKKKTNCTPNTARAFKIGEHLYHSVRLRDHYTFMKVIVSGYMSIYVHENANPQSATPEINDYLKINMGELVLVPKISFRKKIAPLLHNCMSVAQKVEDKTYDFNDLKAMAIDYNQCMANQPTPTNASISPEAPASPANNHIQDLLTFLENNQQTANREDLKTCLNDINTKLRTGSVVPKYLLEALVSLSKPTEGINEKALKLATDLGYQAEK